MAVSDQDFKAAFSLLPVVIRLTKAISTNTSDPQQRAQLIQNIVSELQSQIQRCEGLLESCPALDHTPKDQIALLNKSKRELQLKCTLIHKYKDLELNQQEH